MEQKGRMEKIAAEEEGLANGEPKLQQRSAIKSPDPRIRLRKICAESEIVLKIWRRCSIHSRKCGECAH